MHQEAEIIVNGTKLTDSESMTVRVAIDTLASVLSEGVLKDHGQAVTDRYMTSLGRIQLLLERPQERKQ